MTWKQILVNQLGGGGGGKILLNCTEWTKSEKCFTVTNTSKFDFSSGDTGTIVPGPKYFVTMRMLQLERDFMFNGGMFYFTQRHIQRESLQTWLRRRILPKMSTGILQFRLRQLGVHSMSMQYKQRQGSVRLHIHKGLQLFASRFSDSIDVRGIYSVRVIQHHPVHHIHSILQVQFEAVRQRRAVCLNYRQWQCKVQNSRYQVHGLQDHCLGI